jgi:hypothetical protein
MKRIELTQGKVTFVDDADFEIASQIKWFAMKGKNTHYAASWFGPWKERKLLSLHRFLISPTSKSIYVDHIDGDGLNNQRSNLRQSTNKQNSANRTYLHETYYR